MDNSMFDAIQSAAKYLNLDIDSQEVAQLALDNNMTEEAVQALVKVFSYLKDKKTETIISTQLRLSKLPLKEPKTFENFDFSLIHGKQLDALKALPS